MCAESWEDAVGAQRCGSVCYIPMTINCSRRIRGGGNPILLVSSIFPLKCEVIEIRLYA